MTNLRTFIHLLLIFGLEFSEEAPDSSENLFDIND